MNAIYDVTEAFIDMLETITVDRDTGSYVKGEWVVSGNNPVVVQGVIQPINRNLINELGIEGLYKKVFIVIYSTHEMNVSQDGATGDFITYAGDKYIVRYIDNWTKIGGYRRAICEAI